MTGKYYGNFVLFPAATSASSLSCWSDCRRITVGSNLLRVVVCQPEGDNCNGWTARRCVSPQPLSCSCLLWLFPTLPASYVVRQEPTSGTATAYYPDNCTCLDRIELLGLGVIKNCEDLDHRPSGSRSRCICCETHHGTNLIRVLEATTNTSHTLPRSGRCIASQFYKYSACWSLKDDVVFSYC